MSTKRFLILSMALIGVIIATTSFTLASTPKRAGLPAAGVQHAWAVYRGGERAMVGLPSVGQAFQAYRAGERLTLGKPAGISRAALAEYRAGERANLSLPVLADAFQLYRAGERTAASGATSAWALYRQGEWGR
jgi:hypothetical protein